MKKRIRLLAAVAVLVCAMTILSGCTKSYTGKWCCAYMDTGTKVLTAGDIKKAGTELYIDLRAGGDGIMTADGESQRVTWKVGGDKKAVLLTVNGEIEPFYIDSENDSLVWDMDDVSVTFLREKSDEYKLALDTLSQDTANGSTAE